MPFKNKGNSRDDKSEKFKRPVVNGSGFSSESKFVKPGPQGGKSNTKKKLFLKGSSKKFISGSGNLNDKTGSGFSTDNRSPKSFGRPLVNDKRNSSGNGPARTTSYDQKPFANRPEAGEKKSFIVKNSSEKKSFTDKNEGKIKTIDKAKFGRKRYSETQEPVKKTLQSRFDNNSDKKTSFKKANQRPLKPRMANDPSKLDRPKYRSDDQKWSSEEHYGNKRNKKQSPAKDNGLIRLNRFIANAGICSRRKADELIAAGVVSVNGIPVTELGFKVDPAKDSVRYNGENLKREKMVYVLLNKPKDYITTTDDPQERKTVMNLVEKASRERIYPVGRLDRNTTGLLLMTNDGDLAEKLSHPRNNITKLYQVELNKSLTQGDLNKIQFGIELEDGFIKPDQVSYVTGGSKKEVGIQIHSGKNRIVRRIFESLGYEVVKLDRVVYSHLTKKDLPRGRWRYLEEKEIIQLKHLIK